MYRSIISYFLYAKSMWSIIQHAPYCSTRLSHLSDTNASQRDKYFLHVVLHGKWQRKVVNHLCCPESSSRRPCPPKHTKGGCQSDRGSARPFFLLSAAQEWRGYLRARRAYIHYWANKVSATPPVKPKAVCLSLHHIGEKTNKHAPESEVFFLLGVDKCQGEMDPCLVKTRWCMNSPSCHVGSTCVCKEGFFYLFFWRMAHTPPTNSAFLEDKRGCPRKNTLLAWKVKSLSAIRLHTQNSTSSICTYKKKILLSSTIISHSLG